MNLDIHDALMTALILTLCGVILSFWFGVRTIRAGERITFSSLRRRQVASGWRLIFLAFVLGTFAILLSFYGEPVAYRYFPPSPTSSPTLTNTVTSIYSSTPTFTPTITIFVPAEFSLTPSSTSTPFLPPALEAMFESSITPNPDAVFSPLEFSRLRSGGLAVNPANVFRNPVGHLYASFTYNNMVPGSQWTALWYRTQDGYLVCSETIAWDGGEGGYGFTDCNPEPEEWLAGLYRVEIFVGLEWKISGEFTVEGAPPTSTPTRTPTATQTTTSTPTVSHTATISPTVTDTRTARPTDTRWSTNTR